MSEPFVPSTAEQEAMTDYIVRTVIDDATGEADGDRRVGEPPSARYYLATLAPLGLNLPAGEMKKGRVAPSSAGFEFDVDGARIGLGATAHASVYYRVFPTYEEQLDYHGGADTPKDRLGRQYRLAPVFRRREARIGELAVSLGPGVSTTAVGADEFAAQFAAISAAAAADPQIFRREPGKRDIEDVPGAALESEQAFTSWKDALPGAPVVPEWRARISTAVRPVAGQRHRVTVLLENLSNAPTMTVLSRGEPVERRDDARDHFLFRIGLQVKARGRSRIVPIEMNLGPDAYRYDGRLPAYASNCGVECGWATDRSIEWLRSAPAPVHVTFRTPTRGHPGTAFSVLADDPIPALEQLAAALDAYFVDPAWAMDGMTSEHAERKLADREGFRSEIVRFREGIRWLRRDPRLLLAFRLANRTMIRLNERRRGYSAWHLFQLVFVVSQLPALAWREHDPKEFARGLWGDANSIDPTTAATVLWFPTASGKTEAILGLIACALFYDRCRGKTRGVTAWSRFPLRLLSLQQTQRYLDFVVAADEVRLSAGDEIVHVGGQVGDRFAVGFYVGEGNTPNSLSRDDATLERLIADPEKRREFRVIDECPYCGQRSVEVMPPDRTLLRLVHSCTSCRRELPLYVVDTEIYRYLPAVLLGTIDKLAMIGLSDRFGALLGDVDCECDLHGLGRGMKCHERRAKNHPRGSVRPLPRKLYDPSPSLEVLDELHMIREELGAFAGHYEGILAVTQRQLTARQRPDRRQVRMKVVASTATVKGEDRQCEHLFGLPSVVVPMPGPSLEGSFYWSLDRSQPLRRFVGILPHRFTAEMALVRILQAFHEGIRRLEREGPAAVTDLGSIDPARFVRLLDYYRVSLTYVTSLVDFGKLRRSMETQVNEYLRGRRIQDIAVRELSGDTKFDDVRATLDDLERVGGKTEAVIATSMISHGVDVARLNVMVFNGMPKSMAEYIQASSRVGRSILGVVFMIFNPVRERDRSHFRYHGKFHEYLDRMVEPVAINRWSRYGARKTLPGVLMAEILQFGNRAYWDDGHAPRHLHDLTQMQGALRPPGAGGLPEAQRKALLESVELAYLAAWDGASELKQELAARIDTAVSSIRAAGAAAGAAVGKKPLYRATGDYLGLEYEPMTSLRDVAEGIPFYVIQERQRA